jgi:hypothetical protein
MHLWIINHYRYLTAIDGGNFHTVKIEIGRLIPLVGYLTAVVDIVVVCLGAYVKGKLYALLSIYFV